MTPPNFGRTATDYGRHRRGFPPELIDRLEAHGIVPANLRVLDLGTGTGTLARLFALRGAFATGLDPSAAMMDMAKKLDEQANVSVRYIVGRAEDTGRPDSALDLVIAGQCWHWFDGPAAAAEASRMLVAGGTIVIAYFDWLPLSGNMVEATEALIERHNPSWTYGGGNGLYPASLRHLGDAGFERLETFSFDLPVPYSHRDWRGRIRASAGVGASLSSEKVAAFDQELAKLLATRFPEDPQLVPHRVWAAIGRKPLAAR